MNRQYPAGFPPPKCYNALMDIYLIDGNSYVYRAYFAIRGLTDSKGRPTNAIFGFTNMLLKIIRDLQPGGLAISFDTPHKTERHRLYEAYKAHRPGAPDEMIEQLPYIRKVIEAFRVKLFEVPGYEADDVIATLAARASRAGHNVYIVTADKDMLQLIGERVRVYDPIKNAVLGPEHVMERFGVPPDRVPEFMALVGDAADNIPGVKGVGEKTAKELFAQFKDLDELIAHPERIKRPRTRKLIEENIDSIKLSRQLAVIDRDVPVEADVEDFLFSPGTPDWHALAALFKEFEFTSLMRYVPGEAAPQKKYEVVRSAERLKALLPGLRAGFSLRLFAEDAPSPADGSPSGEETVAGASFYTGKDGGFYLPFAHECDGAQMKAEEALAILKPLFEDELVPKAGHNLKLEMVLLKKDKNFGVELKGRELYDVMIASHLINPLREDHSLEAIALEYLSIKKKTLGELVGKGGRYSDVPLEEAAGFACYEAELVHTVKGVLFERLRQEELARCYSDYEIPLVSVLAGMEETGVKVDVGRLAELSGELDTQLEGIKKRIFFLAGEEFNINSPKQLGHVLFDVLKLTPGKKKKTGYSTEVGVLEDLAEEHELPREILDWRALFKLKTTYVDVLPGLVNPRTGRIHATFNQAVTATGRLSSTNPNLQNIPIRGEWGRKIREAFVPEEGFYIISADYSQIELRVLAHISGDETLKRDFSLGADVHTMTAAEIFGLDPSKVGPEHRRVAKVVNFGVIYGITPFGLSQATGKTPEEAARYISRYFERHTGVAAYMKRVIEEAERTGYVRTISGRKRPIPELRSRDRRVRALGERFAMNSPIQGSAADIIKKAMISIWKAEKRAASGSKRVTTRLMLQVHDELVFESPQEEAPRMTDIIKEEMSRAADLSVPMLVEAGYGRNWAEAH